MSDILDMLVRQDRVKKLLEKKEKEWYEDEKSKKTGGPIIFCNKEEKVFDNFIDFLEIEEDSEEEDSDEEDNVVDDKNVKVIEKLPTLPDDFTFEQQTIEEIVNERIEAYSKVVYHMEKRKFIHLCIQEGILDENQVFY